MKVKLNTILSSFDDKATLLKWLKSVEKALKENVLEEITAEAVTATTSKLIFHFADESTIETPAFTTKGDKGDTGETGPRGLSTLFYTKLYDGELTKQSTINLPENDFNRQPQSAEMFVLYTGTTATAQYALLTVSNVQEVTGYINCYVEDVIAVKGAKGDTGPQGPQGPHGDPIDAYGLAELVTGSATIVVDLNPQETAVEFHLDADVIEKIENSLQLPLSHTERKIVAVDTTGGQEMLGIGEGLEVEAGKLKANVKKLYKHSIIWRNTDFEVTYIITFINTSATNYTKQEFENICSNLIGCLVIDMDVGYTYGVTDGSHASLYCGTQHVYNESYVDNFNSQVIEL